MRGVRKTQFSAPPQICRRRARSSAALGGPPNSVTTVTSVKARPAKGSKTVSPSMENCHCSPGISLSLRRGFLCRTVRLRSGWKPLRYPLADPRCTVPPRCPCHRVHPGCAGWGCGVARCARYRPGGRARKASLGKAIRANVLRLSPFRRYTCASYGVVRGKPHTARRHAPGWFFCYS